MEQGVAALEALAAQGVAEAAEKLGDAYQRGEGVEADASLAIEWYYKGGMMGWGRAFSNIGMMYRDGKGVEQDYAKAFAYFSASMLTEVKDAKAPRYIEYMYRDGIYVEQDDRMAFFYAKIAAAYGDSTGTADYADYLLEGTLCDQDVDTAMALYQKLIDQEEHDAPRAALSLGILYAEGMFVSQDLETAKVYYEYAVNHASSQQADILQAAQEALAALKE